jgi:hypothetical protein
MSSVSFERRSFILHGCQLSVVEIDLIQRIERRVADTFECTVDIFSTRIVAAIESKARHIGIDNDSDNGFTIVGTPEEKPRIGYVECVDLTGDDVVHPPVNLTLECLNVNIARQKCRNGLGVLVQPPMSDRFLQEKGGVPRSLFWNSQSRVRFS